jgi:hypothetical protein
MWSPSSSREGAIVIFGVLAGKMFGTDSLDKQQAWTKMNLFPLLTYFIFIIGRYFAYSILEIESGLSALVLHRGKLQYASPLNKRYGNTSVGAAMKRIGRIVCLVGFLAIIGAVPGMAQVYNGFTFEDHTTFYIYRNNTYSAYYLWNTADSKWYESRAYSTDPATYYYLGTSALGNPVTDHALFPGDGASNYTDGTSTWLYQWNNAGLGYWTYASLGLNLYDYEYASGQWAHQGVYGGWQPLGPIGLSASFLGDGGLHVLDTSWGYQFAAGFGYWAYDVIAHPLFDYNYATGQWKHKAQMSEAWNALGPASLAASFLGDGSLHPLDTSWIYQFDSAGTGGYGYWKYTGIPYGPIGTLFSYDYGNGIWSHQGGSGGWQSLGPIHSDSAFWGDGASHAIDTNWSYQFAGGTGYWTKVGWTFPMFGYIYVESHWLDQGPTGGWQPLGTWGKSARFMGDQAYHDAGGGWGYWFYEDHAYWYDTDLSRYQFDYNYVTGQWKHQGAYGGWQFLGPSGLSAAFLGDKRWHVLDANWKYWCQGEFGYWAYTGVTLPVFHYDYGTGQWQHHDYGATLWWYPDVSGGWRNLGSAGRSAAFIGDGSWQDLGSGWSYQFGGGFGAWKNASLNLIQFAYDYSPGQWYDQGKNGGWSTLGAAELSAWFLGDGSVRSLGNNWNYQYGGSGFATFTDALLNWTVFAYDYSGGQWYDQGKNGGWSTLGAAELSAWFLGDGSVRSLGNNWNYQYGGGFGTWINAPLNLMQFAYDYNTGQWYDEGLYGGWATLGSAWLSSWFVGDGTWHGLGTLGDGHWYYQFTPTGNWGSFMNPWEGRAYIYDYDAGQMYYWNNGTWTPTGPNHYPPIFGG